MNLMELFQDELAFSLLCNQSESLPTVTLKLLKVFSHFPDHSYMFYSAAWEENPWIPALPLLLMELAVQRPVFSSVGASGVWQFQCSMQRPTSGFLWSSLDSSSYPPFTTLIPHILIMDNSFSYVRF